MHEFRKITLSDTEEWDRAAASFDGCDAYHRSGYVNSCRIHGDGEPLLLYYEGEGLRAMNVVMKRDIHDFAPLEEVCGPGEYCDYSTPYGYGGMLIEAQEGRDGPDDDKGAVSGESALTAVAGAYRRFCVSEKVVSEFVRFHPLLENDRCGRYFFEVEAKGPTASIDLSSHDVIWNKMDGKHRNRVRKAMASQITVRESLDEVNVRQFRLLYEETMDRDQARPYYYFSDAYYESMCRDFKGFCTVFCAEMEGVTIATAVILHGARYAHYHLVGTRADYQKYSPASLLVYEAAKWAMEAGCERLHLGGGLGAREDSLYRFKKKFNREPPHIFSVGRKIYNQTIYEKLTATRKFDHMPDYFPVYRGV